MQVTVLKYELPLARPGEGAAASVASVPLDADHTPGNLRVRVVEADGLGTRADGTACEPYATVSVAELTRRRTKRTRSPGPGPTVQWGEAFDFEGTSACAQVVVDVWDAATADGATGGAGPELLGKALLSLSECRAGVPHTYYKHLLEGKVVLRVLFDFNDLPTEAEEEAAYQSQYAAAMKR